MQQECDAGICVPPHWEAIWRQHASSAGVRAADGNVQAMSGDPPIRSTRTSTPTLAKRFTPAVYHTLVNTAPASLQPTTSPEDSRLSKGSRPTHTSANSGHKPRTDLLSTQSIKYRDYTTRRSAIIRAMQAYERGGWKAVAVPIVGRPQGSGRMLTAEQEMSPMPHRSNSSGPDQYSLFKNDEAC